MKRVSIFLSIVFLLVLGVFVYKHNTDNTCGNSISCAKNLTGKYENTNSGIFLGRKVSIPSEVADKILAGGVRSVLGDTTVQKRIEVNLNTQHLYAFEGNEVVMDFPISSGKWYPTPTGTFHIWSKFRFVRMEGGNPAANTYYNLPNVPFVMFYYNDDIVQSRGFSLHGTYWHNNFGHPMSHGCVNMRTEDAQRVYYWSNPPVSENSTFAKNNEGTEIIVYGQAPEE
ncbi:MAG: L,D-transpeptidase [Candidatus Levybacteria bacterium]|nr:L,D-transpeptidase [Candidatus Levybacteria bacterium]